MERNEIRKQIKQKFEEIRSMFRLVSAVSEGADIDIEDANMSVDCAIDACQDEVIDQFDSLETGI